MKMKTLLTILLLSANLPVIAQTIHFGMEASYPPFEYIDSHNQPQGFDVDIAQSLCHTLKASCQFSNQAFDSLIPSLRFKKIDAVISGMDITDARSKQVNFTQSYYHNSAQFIVRKDENLPSIAQLNGKRVGIQNGTTHQKYLMSYYSNIQIIPYSSYQNALLDLQSQRLDAIFGDHAVINAWLKNHPQLTVLGDEVTDPTYFGNGLGIAVAKPNIQLLTQLNQALSTIKSNGTYQKIYNKWFGVDQKHE